MFSYTLNPEWISAFSRVFVLSKIRSEEKCVILTEAGSRMENIQLARIAMTQLGLHHFVIEVPTPNFAPGPIERSTGASYCLTGHDTVVAALCDCDVIVDLTVEGLMHAPQTRKILQSGARILNISNEHPQALARLVPDESLKERVKNAARQCRESKEMIVSSNAGSHLSVDISTAPSVGIWGFTERPGTLSHWPGGIVVCFPQEKTVNGVLVFEPGDINLTFKRYFDSKVIFHIEEDYVTRIEGDNLDARLMREYLHSFAEPEAWATSHVGWGLNAGARYEALAMYDKNDINGTELRALAGNFLFSTGANEFAKRYTRGHFDLPMMGCTIRLDNVCVVSDGKLC